MFLDINIGWNEATAEVLLAEAVSLGFSGVAFTTSVSEVGQNTLVTHKIEQHEINTHTQQQKSRNAGIVLKGTLAPFCLNIQPKSPHSPLQLRRITLDIKTVDEFTRLHNFLKSQYNTASTGDNVYDLVAIKVSNERIWQQILSQDNCADIIVLDFYGQRLPFPLKRGQIQSAARQHFYFEICLDKALTTTDYLQRLLRNMAYLMRFLPENRLIVSSGAISPMQLRSPADIAAILKMMGIKNPQAVLRDNTRNLLARSAARRSNGPAFLLNDPPNQVAETEERDTEDEQESDDGFQLKKSQQRAQQRAQQGAQQGAQQRAQQRAQDRSLQGRHRSRTSVNQDDDEMDG